MFQQGVASEVFVDAVAAGTSAELEAANHPPSKRRKEDASTVEVAEMPSADPEQVVCVDVGGEASHRALLCTARQSSPRQAGWGSPPSPLGWSVSEPGLGVPALGTEEFVLTLTCSFYCTLYVVRLLYCPLSAPTIFCPSFYSL